jgi:hypothetical protein
MQITFQISAIPLKDGTFQPEITMVRDSGSKDFTGYVINQVCQTREEALKKAREHAIEEARQQFGSEVEVGIEIEA